MNDIDRYSSDCYTKIMGFCLVKDTLCNGVWFKSLNLNYSLVVYLLLRYVFDFEG